MGKIVRRKLKYDSRHPLETEKFRSAYSKSTYCSVKYISERAKKAACPSRGIGSLRYRKGKFLFISVLPFPFPFLFTFEVFGMETVCIVRAQQWDVPSASEIWIQASLELDIWKKPSRSRSPRPDIFLPLLLTYSVDLSGHIDIHTRVCVCACLYKYATC